jgi:CrcB protein
MTRFLLVCLAGAVGTGLRYLVGLNAPRLFGLSLPYGTLIVNVVGCFLIALVLELAGRTSLISPTARVTIATGFMGGLTTYSAFNYETTALLRDREWAAGFGYLALTLVGCFASGVLGLALARRIAGA